MKSESKVSYFIIRTDRRRTNSRRICNAYWKGRKMTKCLNDRSHIIIATFVQFFLFKNLPACSQNLLACVLFTLVSFEKKKKLTSVNSAHGRIVDTPCALFTLVSFVKKKKKLTSVNSAHAVKFCVYYTKLTSVCAVHAGKFYIAIRW